MNILHKKIMVVITLMIAISLFFIFDKKSNVMTVFEHKQFVTEKLQKTISHLNEENRTLKEELKISKQQPIFSNSEIVVSKNSLESTLENTNVFFSNEPEIKVNTDVNDYSVVDINKPFNGVDPLSDKQKEKYNEFKNDIDGYQFNERFDMQGFLSDPRFRELHASLGVKLQNYVDKKLKGIELMQYNPEGAKMLIEIDD